MNREERVRLGPLVHKIVRTEAEWKIAARNRVGLALDRFGDMFFCLCTPSHDLPDARDCLRSVEAYVNSAVGRVPTSIRRRVWL